jgi:cell fate (sporulation/competence/biofilm development) regulator YlbF (YheA/YmcA/DUF963 family)
MNSEKIFKVNKVLATKPKFFRSDKTKPRMQILTGGSMQKPLDLARELAKSLADSSEYRNYKAAKAKMEAEEAARVMFEDFRKKQIEFERKRLSGEKSLEPLEAEIRKLTEIVGLNPYVREYLVAEYLFTKMVMDVQKIIGEAVDLKMPAELLS